MDLKQEAESPFSFPLYFMGAVITGGQEEGSQVQQL